MNHSLEQQQQQQEQQQQQQQQQQEGRVQKTPIMSDGQNNVGGNRESRTITPILPRGGTSPVAMSDPTLSSATTTTIDSFRQQQQGQHQQQQQQEEASSTLLRRCTFHVAVKGMMCQTNCGRTVMNALRSSLMELSQTDTPFAVTVVVVHCEVIFVQRRAYVVVDVPIHELDTHPTLPSRIVHAMVDAVECVGFEAKPIDNLEHYLAAFAASADSSHAAEQAAFSDRHQTFHIRVSGMMCQANCGRTVRNALLQLANNNNKNSISSMQVVDAQAIFAEQRALVTLMARSSSSSSLSKEEEEVESDTKEIWQTILDAVENVGFEAEPILNIDHYLENHKQQRQKEEHFQLDLSGSDEDDMAMSSRSVVDEARRLIRGRRTGGGGTGSVCGNGNNASNKSSSLLGSIRSTTTNYTTTTNKIVTLQLYIGGMSCAVCTRRVEDAIRRGMTLFASRTNDVSLSPHDVLPTLADVHVVLATHSAYVEWNVDNPSSGAASGAAATVTPSMEQACVDAIVQAGYSCRILQSALSPRDRRMLDSGHDGDNDDDHDAAENNDVAGNSKHPGSSSTSYLQDRAMIMRQGEEADLRSWRNLALWSIILTTILMYFQMRHPHGSSSLNGSEHNNTMPTMDLDDMTMPDLHGNMDTTVGHVDTLPHWLVCMALATIIQVVIGARYYRAAFKGWWFAGIWGMDFLVVMGTTSSYVYSMVASLATLFQSSNDPIDMKIDNGQMSMTDMDMPANFSTAAMLLTFVTIGKFLEAYAKGKTTSALHSLMALQPQTAWKVLVNDINSEGNEGDNTSSNNYGNDDNEAPWLVRSGIWTTLPTEQVSASALRLGDYVKVLPGARIPTDARLVAVTSATTMAIKSVNKNATMDTAMSPSVLQSQQQQEHQVVFIDESAFSGEPFPVAKQLGDVVTGSTVNQCAVLLIQVTAVGADTALANIVRLMEQAAMRKAPIQAYADRVACIFAPTVMVLAVVTLLAWLLLDSGADSWQDRWYTAITSSIAVIVVACPCALGLATPTAVMVGTGVGATQGLLIKGGAVLEQLHHADTIVFDKTGTLTTGKAVLQDRIHYLQPPRPQSVSRLDDHDNDESAYNSTTVYRDLIEALPPSIQHVLGTNSPENVALWLAACAESQSEHPLAQAVVNAAKNTWGWDATLSSSSLSQSRASSSSTLSRSHRSDLGSRVCIDQVVVVPGRGVECVVQVVQDTPSNDDNHDAANAIPEILWGPFIVRVGSRSWTKADFVSEESANSVDSTGDADAMEMRERGKIAIYVSILPRVPIGDHANRKILSGQTLLRRTVIAVYGIVDPVQGGARSTIAALQGMGMDVWMCTGDDIVTARAVAAELGIDQDNVCAGVQPIEKADLVTRLQQRQDHSLAWSSLGLGSRIASRVMGDRSEQREQQPHVVIFCGDGINDAVSLARADVGMAIGAGTQVAVEAADVVLVRSSLTDVVVAIHLSQAVFRRIILNFLWATSYNVCALPFAAGVLYPFTDLRIPPELAGLMMALSSVSVVTSSLLLRNYRRPIIQENGTMLNPPGIFQSCTRKVVGHAITVQGSFRPQYELV